MILKSLSQKVGHVCSVCDEVIIDQFFTFEGVVMCEKDYQVSEIMNKHDISNHNPIHFEFELQIKGKYLSFLFKTFLYES